jgi:hypothetical protein
MAKWPLKETKKNKNNRRCRAHTCAPPSLKGRAKWPFPTKKKRKEINRAPCLEKRPSGLFFFLKRQCLSFLFFF